MGKRSYILFAFIILVPAFQNCSNNQFSGGGSDAGTVVTDPNSNNVDDINDIDFGNGDVVGGHFDLDTATKVYTDGDGETNEHEHEYDDKNDTNVADFFNLLGKANFDNIQETISSTDSFYIRIANGDLSPRVALDINGVLHPMSAVQHGPFSLSGVTGTTQLSSLRFVVATDAILNSGLVSTQTSCVRDNDFSNDGRYRNGALVIQAIASDSLNDIDPITGVAQSDNALLWEGLIFWHEDGGDCR